MFPEFIPITIEICPEIKYITGQYPPYSDFSSANLFSWNNNGDAMITSINGNLAIYYPDYIGEGYILSFLGDNEIADTTESLLGLATVKLTDTRLDLVPEIAIPVLTKHDDFHVVEAPDCHDYIISLSKLSRSEGKELSHFRRSIRTFRKDHSKNTNVEFLDLGNEDVVESMNDVFNMRESVKTENEPENELKAMKRLLANSGHFNLLGIGVEIEDELRAFIICEDIGDSWSFGHFWKADTNFHGIYSYLMWQTATRLGNLGINFMNIEQDLGIAGLRQFKKSLNPIANLKKYIIQPA